MPKKTLSFQTAQVFLLCWFAAVGYGAVAADSPNKSLVTVNVQKLGETYHVEASYETRLNACRAFAFITDYEDAINIEGIVESKIISRIDNKVIVERKAKEMILFFPLFISSTIEYTERPNLGLDFEQIHGDNKLYKGTWRLESKGDTTKFTYKSQLELNSMVPDNVLEYFVKKSIKKRFEAMQARAANKEGTHHSKCE